jgi:hypothetical protein
LESPLNIIEVIPQSNLPGVRYESDYNSAVPIDHITGISDGQVTVMVIDPARVTGNEYEIFFTENRDSTIAPVGEILWNLKNTTNGDTIFKNKIQAFNLEEAAEEIFDGMLIKVAGPAPDFKQFLTVANAAGVIDPPEMGCFAFNANGFPFLFNEQYPEGSDSPDGSRQQTNGSTWGIHHNDPNDASYMSFRDRVTQHSGGYGENPNGINWLIPRDYEIRFTTGRALFRWPYNNDGTEFMGDVPFQLWGLGTNPTDPADDYQIVPWINDEDSSQTFSLLPEDHRVSGGDNDPFTDGIYWVEPISQDQAGFDSLVAAHEADPVGASNEWLWAYLTNYAPWFSVPGMMRMVLVNWNGGSVSDSTFPSNVDAVMPEEGTIFRIITSKPNSVQDVFRFTAPNIISSTDIARNDVEKINVFPNPYYAFHSEESNYRQRFITFTHLPERATIRIFNLAGNQVRKLEKVPGDGTGQFYKWDLENESGLPVASGFYIAHIDMPDLNKTKTVKFFILQRSIF